MDASPGNQTAAVPATPVRMPWYTLDPRKIGRTRFTRALIIGLLLVSFSVVPFWRLGWYWPLYAASNFVPQRDARGHWRAAWRWVESKEIRVYQAPGTQRGSAEDVAAGVKELLRDTGMAFTVTVLPLPPEVLAAYRDSLLNKGGESQLSYTALCRRLISLRENDPHADMLVIDEPLAECWWAHGIADIATGTAVLRDMHADAHLGKHESAHLLGYRMHDSLPLFVFGYRGEGMPWSRDTLMMINGKSSDVSPRTRDALRYFWRGMERRTGRKYLVD